MRPSERIKEIDIANNKGAYWSGFEKNGVEGGTPRVIQAILQYLDEQAELEKK